jgi:hypothetical protein
MTDTTSSATRAHSRAVRARMAATGENFTVAARALASSGPDRQPGTTLLAIDPQLLAPYPDETGVGRAELGWRVLPADALPQQRARAEATWRPVTVDRPCRCSGPCHHGIRCNNGTDGIGSCTGFLQHYDRYPGSLLELTVWTDDYVCPTCGEEFDTTVTLLELPWGESQASNAPGGTVLTLYPGVRHPNFAEDVDEEDRPSYHPDYCPDCGFDTCVCDRESGCEECGAGDPYGECVCLPE